MPGNSRSPGRGAAAAAAGLPQSAPGTPKLLYAVDATLPPGSPATDLTALTAAAEAAVRAGRGHVLGTSHVVFPNGAVTLVLILAESHLAIHTWPEENLIAIDLFSCGMIDGERVIGELSRRLRLAGLRTQQVQRGGPVRPGRTATGRTGRPGRSTRTTG